MLVKLLCLVVFREGLLYKHIYRTKNEIKSCILFHNSSQIFRVCVCVCFREVLQPLSDLRQLKKKKQEALQHTAITAHLAEENTVCALRVICFTWMLQQDIETIANHI